MTTATATQFFAKIGYTDINPFEVVRVVSDKTIEIREMQAVRGDWKPEYAVGGFTAECVNQADQAWNITSNEAEPIIRIRLNKAGKWQDARGNKYKPTAEPVKFYDYNF